MAFAVEKQQVTEIIYSMLDGDYCKDYTQSQMQHNCASAIWKFDTSTGINYDTNHRQVQGVLEEFIGMTHLFLSNVQSNDLMLRQETEITGNCCNITNISSFGGAFGNKGLGVTGYKWRWGGGGGVLYFSILTNTATLLSFWDSV